MPVKLTVEFDIDKGVIKGMELLKPILTPEEFKNLTTEEARLWNYFGDLLDYDLTSRKILKVKEVLKP